MNLSSIFYKDGSVFRTSSAILCMVFLLSFSLFSPTQTKNNNNINNNVKNNLHHRRHPLRFTFFSLVEAVRVEPVTSLSVGSGALGPRQCTLDSAESYMVCASYSNIPVAFTIQPLAWSAEGVSPGLTLSSCDLY